MHNYLSFGGGVNSVALYLYLMEQKIDFEALFVDHGTDWPETYEYVDMFQEWLTKNGYKPIIVLKPNVEGYESIYDYFYHYKMVPSFMLRICTDKFKVRIIHKYVKKPCFMMLGFDAGEAKRARLSSKTGIENRFPLIEAEIDRRGCKEIIKNHSLPVPKKSGCYICPFQKKAQWVELRRTHPDLFCKAEKMEKRNIKYRRSIGKKPLFLSASKKQLSTIVDENQMMIFKEDEYPPCYCGR